MSYKGRFRPKNCKKYKGDPTKVFYRSLWERRFMHYCDTTPSILEWNSEEIVIPYVSPLDNKIHRYFPDFYIKVRNVSGKVRHEIIEVNPKRQCQPPKKPKRQTQKYLREVATYGVNQAKFKAAEEYCKNRKYNFRILTEEHLT